MLFIMAPTFEQLSKILVPYKKNVTLVVLFNPDRAKAVLDHYDELSPNFITGTKGHLAQSQLEYIVKYGKLSGTKLTFNNDKDTSGGFGRLYCKDGRSYVAITRQLRHYLAYDIYSDHDIVNCHPELAKQLLVTFGLNTKHIDEWNLNRESYFKKMIEKSLGKITRDDCKKIGFCFLYGGDIAANFNKLRLPWNNDPEINAIYEIACNVSNTMTLLKDAVKYRFPLVWDKLPYNPTKPNPDWGRFSSFMQHIERHIVLIMYQLALRSGYQVGDIAHDGLFLAQDGKPLVDCQDYYDACAKDILSDTGFQITIVGKPLTPPNWAKDITIPKSLKYTGEWDAASHILDNYGHLFYHTGGRIYVVVDHEFKASPIGSEIYLNEIICGVDYAGKENKVRFVTETISKIVRDRVLNDSTKLINTLKEFNKGIGILPFKNGVYDMREGKLRPYSIGEVYLRKIDKDYDGSLINSDITEKLTTTVFGVLEEGCQDYFFELLARAFAGHFRDKFWILLLGSRNSGKGTIEACLKLTAPLICHIPAPIETYDTDLQKLYGTFMSAGCGETRLALVNEIKDDPKHPPRGSSEIIKALNSGGDAISARRLHRDCVAEFVCTSPIIWFLNKMPEFHDTAVLNNCSLFNMPYVFDNDGIATNATRKADPNIKEWIARTPGVLECFLDILHKHYKPYPPARIPQCNTKDYQKDDVSLFLARFRLDPDGWVLANDVQAIFPKMDSVAVGKFLKKHWGTAITRVSKRLPTEEDGKTVITVKRVYQGLSYVSQLDDLSI